MLKMFGISSGSAMTALELRCRLRLAEDGGKEVREVRRRDRLEGKNVTFETDQKGEGIRSGVHDSGGERVSLLRAPWNPRSLSPPPVLQVEDCAAAAARQSAGCFGSNQNQSH